MTAIIQGDYVTIGKSDLTWQVIDFGTAHSVNPSQRFAILESGQTGRQRLEPVENLVLHTKVGAK